MPNKCGFDQDEIRAIRKEMRGSVITFSRNQSLESALLFEKVYEENLQSDEAEKRDLLANGMNCWISVD